MMTKFNVGDKVRITRSMNPKMVGEQGVIIIDDGSTQAPYRVKLGNGDLHWKYGNFLELVTPPTPVKPKKSARITALETQVAALEAKVEALEKAGKYPLTERFERESTSNCEVVDAILADIERKAKPTLEALLATYPTPNEQRADVIKRAKAFVAENTIKNGEVVGIAGVEFGWHVCHVEFIVNTEKRAVTLLAKGVNSGEVRAKGIAKCDPDDVFNADIGKAIALARALGVEVPVEFVKAVQPTEVVVGMSAEVEGNAFPYVTPIIDVIGRLHSVRFLRDNPKRIRKILDDTDAVYE